MPVAGSKVTPVGNVPLIDKDTCWDAVSKQRADIDVRHRGVDGFADHRRWPGPDRHARHGDFEDVGRRRTCCVGRGYCHLIFARCRWCADIQIRLGRYVMPGTAGETEKVIGVVLVKRVPGRQTGP